MLMWMGSIWRRGCFLMDCCRRHSAPPILFSTPMPVCVAFVSGPAGCTDDQALAITVCGPVLLFGSFPQSAKAAPLHTILVCWLHWLSWLHGIHKMRRHLSGLGHIFPVHGLQVDELSICTTFIGMSSEHLGAIRRFHIFLARGLRHTEGDLHRQRNKRSHGGTTSRNEGSEGAHGKIQAKANDTKIMNNAFTKIVWALSRCKSEQIRVIT